MSERFEVVIEEVGNAAFVDSPQHEIARILKSLASTLEMHSKLPKDQPFFLRDYNGNKVGSAVLVSNKKEKHNG